MLVHREGWTHWSPPINTPLIGAYGPIGQKFLGPRRWFTSAHTRAPATTFYCTLYDIEAIGFSFAKRPVTSRDNDTYILYAWHNRIATCSGRNGNESSDRIILSNILSLRLTSSSSCLRGFFFFSFFFLIRFELFSHLWLRLIF